MGDINPEQVEILSRDVNAAVVRMPGRRYPGVALQGDSLKILIDSVEDVLDCLRHSTDPERLDEAREELELVLSTLGEYRAVFERVMQERGEPLPY
ncbi:DUF6959 family protein [Pyxidicoccus sp. 3LG]